MPVTFIPAATFSLAPAHESRRRRLKRATPPKPRHSRARPAKAPVPVQAPKDPLPSPQPAKRKPPPVTPVQDRNVRARVAKLLEAAFLADSLGPISDDTYDAVMSIVLPEDHAAPASSPVPTLTAPGSPDRVEVLGSRLAAGERLHTRRDADPIRDDRRSLRGSLRRNGNDIGPEIAGWAGKN